MMTMMVWVTVFCDVDYVDVTDLVNVDGLVVDVDAEVACGLYVVVDVYFVVDVCCLCVMPIRCWCLCCCLCSCCCLMLLLPYLFVVC